MSKNEKEIRINGVDDYTVLVDESRMGDKNRKQNNYSFAELLTYFWNKDEKEENEVFSKSK